MRPSFLKIILITIGIITAALLLLIWFIVLPKYEASVLAERLTVIRQLQKSSIDNLDHTIAGWSNIPRFIISQVTERPNEGETILRMIMTLHPEIIQMRIRSSGPTDELMSQNTSYSPLNLQFSDSSWERSKVGNALQIAWLNQTEIPTQLLAMQMLFQVHRIPFTLTVIWNVKRLNDILAGLPFDKEYSVSIHSPSGIIAQNTSIFKLNNKHICMDTSGADQIVHEGTLSWRILKSVFRSAQLWMVVAVPEKIFNKPVEDFLLYSASLIAGPMFVMTIPGWLLSFQIKRFLKKMETSNSAAGE